MNMIGVLYTLDDPLRVHFVQFDVLANDPALFVLVHFDLVGGVDNAIPAQNLAQILGLVFDTLRWLAMHRQIVVLVGQLSFCARQFDCLLVFFFVFTQ